MPDGVPAGRRQPLRHRYRLTIECEVEADRALDPQRIARKLRSLVRLHPGMKLGSDQLHREARLDALTVTVEAPR